MRTLFALPLLLLAGCGSAQQPSDVFAPAKLITTHFGSAPKGSPPALTWKPAAADAQKFGHLPLATVITTADTVLHPSDDMAFVFFRTAITQEPSEPGSGCWLCEDWLSLALYTKGAGGWTMMKFDEWFTKQGVYDRTAKPELVEAGRTGKLVRVISSDGEPEHSSTTHRLFGVPGLREALSIATEINEVERGGADGPMGEPVNNEYRFIPSDKDWYDVEVEENGAQPVRWVYSSATGKYVLAAKAPAR